MLVFVLVYILFCTQQFELETLHVFVAFQIRFVEYDRIELNRRIGLYKYLSINILYSDVAYSVFVDLFSGSGGIGIEAISRGAKKAYFEYIFSVKV